MTPVTARRCRACRGSGFAPHGACGDSGLRPVTEWDEQRRRMVLVDLDICPCRTDPPEHCPSCDGTGVEP